MNGVSPLPLTDKAEVVRGVTFSKGDAVAEARAGYTPVLRAGNIQGHLILDTDLVYIPEQMVSEKQRLRRDDIVMCTSSGSAEIVGKTAFADQDWIGSFGAFCAVVRPKPGKCDPRYLFHYLQTPRFREWTRNSSGVGIKNIRKSELDSYEVPFPNLDEQRRIAAILDKADAIRRKREQALALADDFLKSVFLEMFGDLSSNSRNWRTKSIGQILELEPQNGLYRHSSDYGSGTRILRIDGFYDGYLSAERDMKRLNIDHRTVRTYELINGDIVINRVNSPEYLGKCALIEGLTEPTVFESNMMRFRVDAKIANPRFVVDQLRSTYLKNQIARAAKPAVNQSSINQKDAKSFEVRLPPPELQNKYAEFVAAKLNADNGLQSAFSMAISLLGSLSQRAFRGEL
ncbi:restriction endonuclease subunit S [Methylocella tundrae]|uniref:Type I restriction modification DNA specificity domain-containing protein n=1 Tax=Methylocella tundrae TaxID=227605 RepID=A0A4U8Z7F1_METTU|nr:restriction endonuclease subunit S [Methylocella tundrae]WPP02704.1 restriction endonuclease subunit S [Methylocella tundrae]VFU17375.1 conserved protein of unknown function [Methylocella tundrae]